MVVLNFNGLDDTLECLDSLMAQTCRGCEILVIDNGSAADDLSRISARFPAVELIALPENRGWAGGNNVGLRLAVARGFDYVCLLNNDTVLEPDALEQLVAAVGIIGEPCLMEPISRLYDDRTHVQGNWQLPLDTPDPEVRGLAAAHGITELPGAYGACLLFSTEVVRRVGELDERFFLQLEETDYFRRGLAQGIRSYCAFRAQILHKESVSFGARFNPAKTYYRVRNSLLLAEKHDRGVRARLTSARQLVWSLRRDFDGRADASGSTWLDFARWLVSRDPTAAAAREGVRDYLFRRFGKRSAR